MTPQILVKGLSSGYELEHLARLFFPGAPVHKGPGTGGPLIYARAGRGRIAAGLRDEKGRCRVATGKPGPQEKSTKQALCRLLYHLLKAETGLRPPWGLLTGVRPVNHLRKRTRQLGPQGARAYFAEKCDVSPEKLALAESIVKRQQPVLDAFPENSYSLYVSIPFCPSRCAYCSFVSRTIEKERHLVAPYLEKLLEELAETAQVAKSCGLRLASLYVGGGTPTALDTAQLDRLLCGIAKTFDVKSAAEYTVEAGRPDCTSYEKLALLKQHGVTRLSINPQTLSDEVLRAIGRRHTVQDFYRCLYDARKAGHHNINADLIAGLPGDTEEGFADTLRELLALRPENITLHTLTLKRASDLVIDHRQAQAGTPGSMVAAAYPRFAAAGYAPYYLYRQKSGVENLENTGWALPGQESLYNIFIMEEVHSILACGAGASTKLVRDGGRVIRRRYNHKLPLEYIEHFEEVINRKREVGQFYAGNLDTETAR